MNPVPCIPENAPFSAEQRLWLNGFLAGLFSQTAAAPSPAAGEPGRPLLVMWGSQTGTAETLATTIAAQAKAGGFAPRVVDMAAHETVDLARETFLLIVTSTWGEGDPPDNAVAFWDRLQSAADPLPQLQYSVLALGDSNYSEFCGAGKKFDDRLAELGARRIRERADCDVDYETPANAWIEAVLGATPAPLPADALKAGCSRKNPFPARLLLNRRLNRDGSEKDVRHFEIGLAESGLEYEVGDALGVVPQNCPELVEEILLALKCDGEEAVPAPDGSETGLRQALARDCQITQIPPSLLAWVARRSGEADLLALCDEARVKERDAWLWGQEIIDLLLAFPGAVPAPAEFVGLLRKLQPRLYSISSSLKAHPGQVHLTVGRVGYHSRNRARKGVCSTFLSDRLHGDATVPVFVQVSKSFRLPEDADRPVIMVGPGTGIAPFRAFLHDRRASGARGRNWLFFGEQRAGTDFYYEDELDPMLSDGHLTRLSLAFSRDQPEKIYVQHRMMEAASELWAWLQEGAHFYVCGDAGRMAKDVDAALHAICETAGGLSSEAASDYVKKLKSEKRYQRDVY